MAYRALDSIMRHIRRLAPAPGDAGLGDGALLERFIAQRDEAAFETLLQRHGPMVLGVCRRILHDPHAVDDAFQVTFLVFLRKAHSLRRQDLLGNWLYGVAYRTALKARGTSAKRRVDEQPLADMPGPETDEALAWRDLRPLLDEEISRLPAKYRQPIVLCYLEGRTVTEAAAQLGWPSGTVAGRLARAKETLRSRLTRRGLTLSASLLGSALSQSAPAAVPAGLLTATIRSAAIVAAGQIMMAPGLAASVSFLLEGVDKAMFINKLKISASILLTMGAVGGGVLAYSKVAGQHFGINNAGGVVGFVQQPGEVKPAEVAPQAQDPRFPKTLPTLGKDKAAALIQASNFSDKLAALIAARYDAARTEVDFRWGRSVRGLETQDILLGSCLRLIEAERELSNKQADQLAALENHAQRMKEVEKIAKAKADAGRNTPQDLAQAQFYRLQAEIWLERMKGQ